MNAGKGGHVVSSKIRILAVFLLVGFSILFPVFSVHAADQVAGKKFYTTVNIWYDRGPIESTNYHKGTIIPLGTNVTILEVDEGSSRDRNVLEPQVEQEPFIRFQCEGGQSYKILFKRKYAKTGMSIRDLFKQYFLEKDPKADSGPFRSLTADEQKNILSGEIAIGMTKPAVLMAYGYPPSHKTPSLDDDIWTYWDTRKTRTVEFADGRVTDDSGPAEAKKGKKEKREKREKKEKKSSPITDCIEACKENTHRTPEQCFDVCNK